PVFNVDDWTIKEDYDGTYGISAYLGSEKNVLVPAELDGKKIKRICNNAFLNSSVTSVVLQNGIEELQEYSFVSSTIKYIALPDSITYFGAKFRYAHCLEKIDLPSTLTYISSNCFENCKELRELDIPDSVEEIDCYAFRNCPKLERIKLPANLKELYYGTFKNCTSLMAISIPGSVESIQYDTFNGCTSLAYVTLNNGIKQIDNNAFYNCSSLKEINIPASVIYIDNNPFKGCNSVKSVVVDSNNLVFDSRENCNAIIETAENCLVVGFAASTIPSSVIGLGKWAFGFSEIESIDLPEGLIYFGESAFAYCNQLKSLSIPKNVKYISDNLCARCENLTSVSIPEGVLSIGDSFFGCTSLKEITIPDSVTFIGSFSGDTSLTKVNFGKGLKVIDDYAFNGCTALKNLSLPNGLRYIGDNAFIGCSSLTSVTIPETVENIGAFSFKGCTALDNIVIPEKAISIGVSAFVDTAYYNKESNWIFYHTAGQFMKQLYIGKHLILSIMFYVSSSEVPSFNYTETGDVLPIKNGTITIADCANHENISGYVSGANSDYSSKYPKVTTVIIPDSVKHIGAASFTRIDTLENVTLPASLEEIGNYAFYQCKLNANMKIPRSVTHVGQDAFTFKDYPEGEDVIVDDVLVKKKKDDGVIKDGIRIIADRACQENFQTDVINIPSSVETIGQYAFYGSSASKINFSYGIKRIYKNAFSEMSNLEYVSVIPDSVTYLGAPIFDDMHRNYLRTLQLPNGINNIDFSVISGTDIDTLVIPKSVKTIYCSGGYNSFSENGFKIYYEGTEAEWKNIEIKESSYSNERFIVLQYADYCKMYENDSYTRENCTPMEELLANAEMHYNCNYYTSSGDNNPGSETPQTPQSQPAQSSNNGASSPTATTPPASQTPVTKITLKKVTVKKSAKKLVLQATVKVDGKAVKGKKVTFKFNGKKYTAKTNAKGIAKVTIKKSVLKKLKVGKKVTYTVTWNKITAKRSVKVKK
ncbi:MAG: leucine-rich repeat protein, partial [Eubacterium sp.]|nr:leucine-rich repeat protein [Eubacterium sp.]